MLLETLKRKCIESLLSENRFASDILRMSPTAWNRIKLEKRPITRGDCVKIVAAFPELRDEVLAYRFGVVKGEREAETAGVV